MYCLYASANQKPANSPAIARIAQSSSVVQSGILSSFFTLPRANPIPIAITILLITHTTKNAISIPTLYHIRDEKNVLIQARNIDLATLSGNYSFDEQDTGFTWVDGKTIYKKTFSFTTSSSAGQTKTIDHNITNFNSFIRAEGDIYNGGTGQFWAIPFYFDSSNWVSIRCSTASLFINSGATSLSGVITIYYTKTS